MTISRFIIACTLIFVGVAAAFAYVFNSPGSIANGEVQQQGQKQGPIQEKRALDEPPLGSFEFQREGAASPEDAAESLFLACATESPKQFVQHILLGVCDGPIDTLQKFAECLHSTKFRHGEDSFTVYDLPFGKGIDPKKAVRAIASQDFDRENKQVVALERQMLSTYYGEQFKSVDLVAESYDGLEYQTRIVVARVKDRWYAMPRCRSSKSFYEVADAMRLPSPEANEASANSG